MKNEWIQELLSWYKEYKRDLPWRKTKNAYLIWVSEIMLQQTRVEAVIPYYERFIKRLPTLKDLSEIEEDELLKLWEGLGYYSRVRNMQKCAKNVIEQGKVELPSTYEELIKLPGIGPYTAGAIASIALGEKVPAVDGNVLRVYSRLVASFKNVSDLKVRKEIEKELSLIMPTDSGDFNQALMELGATICIPGNPRCNICPIQKYCSGYKQGNMWGLPIKDSKKEKKEKEYTIFLLFYQNKVAVKKRPSKGLLASLFEFPNIEGKIELDFLKEKYKNATIIEGNRYKHIFTHQIWNMNSYCIHLNKKTKEDYIWASLEDLATVYTIPSAFGYFLEDIKRHIN